MIDQPTEPEELCRIRIIRNKRRTSVVVLCQFLGEEEYVLQHFRVRIHTPDDTDDKPGNLEFSRERQDVKKYGRMDRDGEIIK